MGLIGWKLIVCSCLVSTVAQLLDTHRGPWTLVLKATPGKGIEGYSSLAEWYLGTGGYNENDIAARTDFRSTSEPFRSTILDQWGTSKTISAVRMSMFKDNQEVAWIVFDAFGKSKDNFMDCGKILDSKWTDITTEPINVCQITNNADTGRHFFVNRQFNLCFFDAGWMMVKDYNAQSGCEWDNLMIPAPYFIYSGSTGNTIWNSSEKQYADSFAIFVLEWQMVFKGVEGVVPSAGSLTTLWKGTSTDNDMDKTVQTLTTAPSQTYKSSIIENWNNLMIDMVKYSFFTQGEEKTYVVFDGKNTDKNSWFSDGNILFSKYTDIKDPKSACSIDGDGVRTFLVHKSYGDCSSHQAWINIADVNGFPFCSWDENVRPRPYFLYSAGTTVVQCQAGGEWNSVGFPAAETMGIFVKGWLPVLQVAKGMSVAPASGIYDLWTGTYTLNEHNPQAMPLTGGSATYKSRIVDQWNQHYISAVRVSIYKNGEEQKYMVFDAHGADKTSWFSSNRILHSSWEDISRTTATAYDSIAGQGGNGRYFFLQKTSADCASDEGWFVVVETGGCDWEQQVTHPYVLYSQLATAEPQNTMEIGDVFAIFVSMDLCSPNPCQNGGTCHDLITEYQCECSNNWFGIACTDIDGQWSTWTEFSACSVTCGGGTQTRARQCDNPAPTSNGAGCVGLGSETQACNTEDCPQAVDGQWSAWTEYSTCSVTCGGGTQTQTRECNNPAPANNGANCTGDGSATRECNTDNCPVDGQWSTWTEYSACSVTCGGGTQTQTRECNNPTPAYNGANCTGDGSATRECNTENCPVDGQWSTWTEFSACSVTCGGGTQTRTHECNNPAPAYNGANCTGNETETQECNINYCPVDGQWSTWTEYSTCSVTCGGGTQTQTRECNNPAPAYNGANCTGDGSATRECNTDNCPVDGQWSTWGEYGPCSLTCGSGIQIRTRECDNPAPAYNGTDCEGDATCIQLCNTQNCTVDGQWSTWTEFSACSVTCGGGTQTRTRECNNPAPAYNGANCTGNETETQECNINNCPVDGQWSTWTNYSVCSVTCGGGTQTRTRECNNPAPAYNGANCTGNETATQECNTENCPVDGGWGDWGSWGTCTKTCGEGISSRSRTCDSPSPEYGGLPCNGNSSQFVDCYVIDCPVLQVAYGNVQVAQVCPETETGQAYIKVLTEINTHAFAECGGGNKYPLDLAPDGMYEIYIDFEGNETLSCVFTKQEGVAVYSISIIVPTSGDLVTAEDQPIAITCTYDSTASQDSANATITDGKKVVQEIVHYLAETSRSTVELCVADIDHNCITGEITIGKVIAIKAQLKGNVSDEKSFLAMDCKAKSGSTSIAILIVGCGDGSFIPRDQGFITNGTTSISPYFRSFKISGNNPVTFDCTFAMCASNCDGSSCSKSARRKRDTSALGETYIIHPKLTEKYTSIQAGTQNFLPSDSHSQPTKIMKTFKASKPFKIPVGKVELMQTNVGEEVKKLASAKKDKSKNVNSNQEHESAQIESFMKDFLREQWPYLVVCCCALGIPVLALLCWWSTSESLDRKPSHKVGNNCKPKQPLGMIESKERDQSKNTADRSRSKRFLIREGSGIIDTISKT